MLNTILHTVKLRLRNDLYCVEWGVKLYSLTRILLSSRVTVRIRIRFSDWLVIGYAHVFILLSVVIVTLPRVYVGRLHYMLQRRTLKG